jgi:hypothetical protein
MVRARASPLPPRSRASRARDGPRRTAGARPRPGGSALAEQMEQHLEVLGEPVLVRDAQDLDPVARDPPAGRERAPEPGDSHRRPPLEPRTHALAALRQRVVGAHRHEPPSRIARDRIALLPGRNDDQSGPGQVCLPCRHSSAASEDAEPSMPATILGLWGSHPPRWRSQKRSGRSLCRSPKPSTRTQYHYASSKGLRIGSPFLRPAVADIGVSPESSAESSPRAPLRQWHTNRGGVEHARSGEGRRISPPLFCCERSEARGVRFPKTCQGPFG